MIVQAADRPLEGQYGGYEIPPEVRRQVCAFGSNLKGRDRGVRRGEGSVQDGRGLLTVGRNECKER
jgi:hypothetical protein